MGFTVGGLISLLKKAIGLEKKARNDLETLNNNLDKKLSESIIKWREAEKQLFHSQRMESIGLLTSGVAHEFNNILSIIQFSMELYSKDDPRNNNAELEKKIFSAIDRASALIKKLMIFSRRTDENQFEDFDLVEAIEACKNDDAVRQVGIEWAIEQSKDLIDFGVPCIHYYTMGKSISTREIVKAIY